jgi:SAM-dependent methyltransferase
MNTCRHCHAPLTRPFVDLGSMPPANAYRRPEDSSEEKSYPLKVMVCDECLLVQLDTTVPPESIFCDYDYFSSTSPSWVAEAGRKCSHLVERFTLGPESLVVEVGSNDGYLLRHFVERGIPVLGIDPAEACAEMARRNGVPTITGFFGESSVVSEWGKADIVTGTNVFAHVPDINDFVAGLAKVVKPDGVVIMEFPHLLTLIEGVQFDTIYHEHYFYFSLQSVLGIFRAHGLYVFDVEELPTHGGSLRVYASLGCQRHVTMSVRDVYNREIAAGLHRPEGYKGFQAKVDDVASNVWTFLTERSNVAAYGAPAKGSTFLNFCGVDSDRVRFAVDDSPHKQGKLMPGSGVPIVGREHLLEQKPDYVLILPWNLAGPIRERNPEVAAWGGKWVTAIPEINIQ